MFVTNTVTDPHGSLVESSLPKKSCPLCLLDLHDCRRGRPRDWNFSSGLRTEAPSGSWSTLPLDRQTHHLGCGGARGFRRFLALLVNQTVQKVQKAAASATTMIPADAAPASTRAAWRVFSFELLLHSRTFMPKRDVKKDRGSYFQGQFGAHRSSGYINVTVRTKSTVTTVNVIMA